MLSRVSSGVVAVEAERAKERATVVEAMVLPAQVMVPLALDMVLPHLDMVFLKLHPLVEEDLDTMHHL